MTGSQLRAVLEDKAAEVEASSSDFWIMVAALKVRLLLLSCIGFLITLGPNPFISIEISIMEF